MKTGRSVWFINGNLGSEQAISIVEKAKATLDLQTVKIENLPDVRGIALEPKTSFLIEEPLVDEKNENSCAVAYYEVGVQGDDLR